MKPIIHVITNYVTAPDTAQLLSSLGASPIMSDSYQDLIYSYFEAKALLVNTGTPSPERAKAMKFAYERAVKENVPIVLDPVGYGTTQFRTELVNTLLAIGKPTVIKGNYSELYSLYSGEINRHGVGSETSEESTQIAQFYGLDKLDKSKWPIEIAKKLSIKLGTVVILTGERDYISAETVSGLSSVIIGGNPLLSKISGSGCLLGAYIAYKLASKWNAGEFYHHNISSVFDIVSHASRAFRDASEYEAGGAYDLKRKLIDTLK